MAVGGYERAAEAHRRAVGLYNTGRPARALTTLRRAQRTLEGATDALETDRDTLGARIWISIALNESEVHSVEAGFAALATAEELARRVGDPALEVLLHCQRGLIELRGGSLSRSRVALDAAVELIDHAEARDQANILLTRGSIGLAEGRLSDARRDFRRAVEVARAAGLRLEEFKTLHNLAYVEFLAGDLTEALQRMNDSARIDLGQEWGIVLLDRARILSEAGLAHDADLSLGRAAQIFRTERVAQDLAETELERARCALVMNDTATARRLAAAARSRFARRGSVRWQRTAELVLLQADLAAGRPGARLSPPATQLYRDFQAEGLRLPARSAALLLAEAQLASGRVEAAEAALSDVGAARRDDPITGRMHTHYVHARIDTARGRTAGATRHIRRALDELARYQASFGSIDLRTASAVHGRRLAELDISLALDAGRPSAVFAAAERARAVSSRLPPVRPPDDQVAAELLAELRQNVEALRYAEQDRAAFEPLLRRRRELERTIVARTWAVSGSGAALRPARADEVLPALRTPGCTMVMYLQARGALWAVLLADRLRLVALGSAAPVLEWVRRVRADLDVLAQPRMPGGLRGTVRASLQRGLEELDASLITPLGPAQGPLVLVSTGALGRLPWASLPSLRGVSLVVAPSATKWFASAGAKPRADLAVAAFAGPELGRGADEAAAVAAAWPGASVTTDAGSTCAAFTRAVSSADVLHVAAHGIHQSENPLFSSLRMADGPVFAHELDRAGRAPEHVVLSACEVGLTTVRPGDEALGLASVLLHLGTRSVVAGLARVGDEVAAQTMAAYHSSLSAGSDSAAALAHALLEVDSDVVPPFVNFGTAWLPPQRPSHPPASTS